MMNYVAVPKKVSFIKKSNLFHLNLALGKDYTYVFSVLFVYQFLKFYNDLCQFCHFFPQNQNEIIIF